METCLKAKPHPGNVMNNKNMFRYQIHLSITSDRNTRITAYVEPISTSSDRNFDRPFGQRLWSRDMSFLKATESIWWIAIVKVNKGFMYACLKLKFEMKNQ